MPWPLILWGAAAALGATGIYKGVKAKDMLDDAKRIGEEAEAKQKAAQLFLESSRSSTNDALQALGKTKVDVMSDQIQHLVNVLKKRRSEISDFDCNVSAEELKQYEKMVKIGLEIEAGLGASAVGGALAAMGAYGAVGTLATASTGAAITGLSGVAATNATLAWLGGGSLAAGGFGMAGGMVALGGIVLGPALAIGGFMLASKAEEALTEARRYEAKVDEACEKINIAITGLKAIRSNAAEMDGVLLALANKFDAVKVNDMSDKRAFQRMLDFGKAIKEVLITPVLDKDGAAVMGLSAKLACYKQVAGPSAG